MHVTRFGLNPLITVASHPSVAGNITGPSVIRWPEWLGRHGRFDGRYLMHFAHHHGQFIRVAMADDLRGPWRIDPAGTMPIGQIPFTGHIASPDVHVDHERQQLVMYVHGHGGVLPPEGVEQPTLRAISNDGITWAFDAHVVGESYFRVFNVRDRAYAIAKGGRLYAASEAGRFPLTFDQRRERLDFSGRHFHMLLRGDRLHVVYSRWGDAPEHLLHATIDIRSDWMQWRLDDRHSLLKPEFAWEGAGRPRRISLPGSIMHPANELRDPCFLQDGDDVTLFYIIAGEQGVAGATAQFRT